MALTIQQLVNKLARIGVIEAAADGAFHDLPYGQGSGGSGAEMILYNVTQDSNNPPGMGQIAVQYPTAMEYPAFVSAVVLDPKTASSPDDTEALNYAIQVKSTKEYYVVIITSSWAYPGKTDPLPSFNQKVGVRLEHFIPTTTLSV